MLDQAPDVEIVHLQIGDPGLNAKTRIEIRKIHELYMNYDLIWTR